MSEFWSEPVIDLEAPIVPGGHFKWKEYCLLREWGKYADPSLLEKQNAIFLFSHIEPLRVELNKVIEIRSGARTAEYTRHLRANGIPAALNSAHNTWQAVDIIVPDMKVADLWKFFRPRWKGRMEQLASTPTWVHLDVRQFGQSITFRP